MSEGYSERKAAQDMADLKSQVREMKVRLWRYEKDASIIQRGDKDSKMEDYAKDPKGDRKSRRMEGLVPHFEFDLTRSKAEEVCD